ncbi:MAG: acylphosphatase [Puniceicoccales bacterium]|jgi:acylphosphatase|nr:acylphosphatase [Puniceicoccales bacterium]
MSLDVFHKDVWFEGHVQGVGFRADVLGTARGFEVSGVVKNLVDGRVLLQVEGREGEVTAFLSEVRARLGAFIRRVEERDFWGAPCFSGFALA